MSKNSNSESENERLKEELKKAELELKIIEVERKIAEGRREIFAPKIFDAAATPLEGKITLGEKADLEARILSYKAIGEIASEIALEVGRIGSERVMIYSQSHLEMIASYRSFMTQIKLLSDEYETALKVEGEVITKIKGRGHDGHIEIKEYEHMVKEEAERLKSITAQAAKNVISTVAPIAMKSFMDIASLFKSDTNITFSEFNLVEEALMAEVANHLKYDGIEVIYPGAVVKGPEAVLAALFDLNLLKERAEARLLKIDEDGPGAATKERLQVLNHHHDMITSALAETDKNGGESLLEDLIKAESISFYLDKEGTDLLALKPVYAGGNNKVRRRFFSSKLFHAGGAIITYILSAPDGVVKSSKTFYNYTGYRRFKNLKRKIGELNNFEIKADQKKGIKLRADKDEDFI